MLDALGRDIRFAIRTFRKAPVFTCALVATIALAVGATTSIFAVVNAILLRPLPFPDSDRVVRFCETNPSIGEAWCGASPMNVTDWDRASALLDSAGVARREGVRGRSGGESFSIAGGIVSPGFLRTLGLRPLLGRLIEERDMPRGANRVALVSYEFWQRRLGGDRLAIGRGILLNDQPYTVVGVLRPDAYLPNGELAETDLWRPLTASIDDVEDRSWRGFTAIGLKAPGVSDQALFAELDTIRSRLARDHPEANREWGLRLVGLRESLVGSTRPTLLVFLGSVGFVLLIACANVASLLLVRATGRGVEFAVRSSLGAGRRRLVQQLVTESLVLAVVGGALGLLLASWVTSALVAIAPANLPRLQEVSVDGRVAAFALGLAAVTALVFGFAPAHSAARTDLNGVLKGTRATGDGRSWLRPAFVVVQLSLALMLLFGAGLLTRSFGRLLGWQPGFDRAGLVTAWLSPAEETTQAAVPAMERVREAVTSVPGVRSAALASAGPLFGGEETDSLAIAGRPVSGKDAPAVQWFDVSPEYFETLGVRLVRGRQFSAADDRHAAPVAIVNETLVRRFFAGSNPIGHRITVGKHLAEIVGVVADVEPLRADRPTPPQVYWPIEQYPRLGAMLVLRTTPGVAGVEKAVRARVAAIHPDIQLSAFIGLDERVAKQLVSPRFNMLLIAAFALVAVLLAGVGVYGVIAQGVASRSREFGVRIALGATSRTLVRTVLVQGVALVGVAILVGGAGALALSRLLGSLLYGLPARDPLMLLAAAAVLGLVAVLACWLPARRASRIDPISALRAQ